MGPSGRHRLCWSRLSPASREGHLFRIVRLLALDAKFLKTAQVIVAGEGNARVGELKNEVEETKLKASSEDKVIKARGRFLMREMKGGEDGERPWWGHQRWTCGGAGERSLKKRRWRVSGRRCQGCGSTTKENGVRR